MLLLLVSIGFALSLKEAISIAKERSPTLQIQRYRLQQAALIWPQTLARVSPKIFLNANYTRNQQEIAFSTTDFLTDLPDFIEIPTSAPVVIQPLNAQTWRASLTQPLLDAQTPSLLMAAKAHIRSAQYQAQAVENAFTLSFAELFIRKQMIDQNIEILKTRSQLVKESMEMAEMEYRSGAISLQKKLDAQIDHRSTDIQLLQLQNQSLELQQQLEQLMGASLPSKLSRTPLRPLPNDVQDAIQSAAIHRSDGLSIEESLKKTMHQRRARLFEWIPVVESNLNYSYANNIAFSDQNTLWSVQVNANWLIWDGGIRLQQQRMDQIQAAIYDIELKQKRDDIENEIRTEWRKRDVLLSQMKKARLDQDAARLNLTTVTTGHENRVLRDWDLKQAQLLLSQSDYLYQQVEAELYLQNFKILMLCYEGAFVL